MKGTDECQDQERGWVKKCEYLISSLEETHNLLTKIIGPTMREEGENVAGASVADELERRLSEAIQLTRSVITRMNELVNRF